VETGVVRDASAVTKELPALRWPLARADLRRFNQRLLDAHQRKRQRSRSSQEGTRSRSELERN